jgi:hypothetical protein
MTSLNVRHDTTEDLLHIAKDSDIVLDDSPKDLSHVNQDE